MLPDKLLVRLALRLPLSSLLGLPSKIGVHLTAQTAIQIVAQFSAKLALHQKKLSPGTCLRISRRQPLIAHRRPKTFPRGRDFAAPLFNTRRRAASSPATATRRKNQLDGNLPSKKSLKNSLKKVIRQFP